MSTLGPIDRETAERVAMKNYYDFLDEGKGW